MRLLWCWRSRRSRIPVPALSLRSGRSRACSFCCNGGRGVAEGGVLVLGAGGFIGGALVARLAARGDDNVVAALRAPCALAPGVAVRVTGQLSPATDWPALLAGARAVVHLASRAHQPPAPGQAWIEEEVAIAASFAQAARREGVQRIVLMSSVKVHGETSGKDRFRASDRLAPLDPYG